VKPALLDTLEALHADSFGWALACCGWQRAMAEDVLQDAYLRVADGRARFAGRSSPRTWFFGVIKRVAAEHRRSQNRSAILSLRLLRQGQDEKIETCSGEGLYRDQAARQLQAGLMQLAERQREVLHLVFYAELTLEEVAQTLQISLGSARTHYHRGKQRLAKLLAEQADE
jgi:RNA polymerase sigma-70 factor (ECF subfamily)